MMHGQQNVKNVKNIAVVVRITAISEAFFFV
jgi:hypothetical protein